MRGAWIALVGVASSLACSLPSVPGRQDAWVHIDPGPWQDLAYDPGPAPDAKVDPGPPDGDEDRSTCTPQCWSRVCGDNGCGGVCGTCPAGTTCSSDGSLCISKAVQKPFGAECLADARCSRWIRDEWHEYVYQNPSWPLCLDDECAEGPCVMGACSRSCKPGQDVVQNGTGVPVGDGIDDSGEGECAGARTDVFPGGFTCVLPELVAPGAASPSGRCVPRSSFTPCDQGTACPAGEWCGFLRVSGQLEARCLASPIGGLAMGARCGSGDPGDRARCASSACSEDGCTSPCAPEAGCLTPGARCLKGTCEAGGAACDRDEACSAWSCRADVRLVDVPGLFAACAPRTCVRDADCRDPGFFCGHGADASDAERWTLVQRCVPRLAGGASTGEPCRGAGTGRSPIPCADQGYCLDGRCGAACLADEDCPAGMACSLADAPVDLDGDGVADGQVAVPLCRWIGFPGSPCEVAGDCPAGECTPWVARGPSGAEVRLSCAEPPPGSLPAGAPCGAAAFGATCRSRLCLGEDASLGVAGYCSQPCRTDADCPVDLPVGPDPRRWVCAAVRLSGLGTPARDDDLYASWCVALPGDSSLAECGPGVPCADPAETCRSFPRAGPPSPVDVVSFRCVRAVAGGGPGAPCDPAGGGADCRSGSCAPTALSGVGFCTAPCGSDADCGSFAGGGAACLAHTVLPRKSPGGDSLVVPECRLKEACLLCADDTDCAPGMRCADVEGQLFYPEYRCAPACQEDADCGPAAPGSSCGDVPWAPGSGASPTVKVCAPLTCPG